MQIERQETGTLTATLKVRLTPEDYTPGVEKALKEQRKQAVLPGFRPGQVPMPIIRKRVGKAVLVNEVERLIEENLNAYIRDNQLRLLGQPLPRNEDMPANNWEEPGDLEFAYEMGMAPVFDVELSERMGVTFPVVEVDDALVDREVQDMRRRHGRMEDAERAEANDMLLGDMIELDAQGAIKEGGIMNRVTISLEYLKDEATRQRLVGRGAGDEVRVDPHLVSDGHEDLARMLGVDHDRVHHLEGEFLLRVAAVKRMAPAELGPELFDRIYGQGAVADEAAFRERVREGLTAMFRRESDKLFRKLVMDRLMQDLRLELPDAFLKRWIVETSKEPISLEDVEAGYAGYTTGLKRQLLEDRIVEKFGLEAKGEEIHAFAQRYIADQFAQYGMPAPEGEELQRMVTRMLSDRDQVKRMRDTIVEQKLNIHFRTLLQPKEEAMPYDRFVNLARGASATA